MTTHEMPERMQVASNLYARIVVALDGSARAELVLPYSAAPPTRCCYTRPASFACKGRRGAGRVIVIYLMQEGAAR